MAAGQLPCVWLELQVDSKMNLCLHLHEVDVGKIEESFVMIFFLKKRFLLRNYVGVMAHR